MRAFDSLRRQSEFSRLYRRGRRTTTGHFIIYRLQRRPGPMLRLGLAIGKPVGGAVQRNLVRRRIQGTLDTLDLQQARDLDVLIVAKPGAAELEYRHLCSEIRSGLGIR